MQHSSDFIAALKAAGVGKRPLGDPYFEQTGVDRAMEPLLKKLGVYDTDVEELCHEFARISCAIPRCLEEFDTIIDFDVHYNSVHRFVCDHCRRRMPSAHFLDLHIQEKHDSYFAVMAERKPSYSCLLEECMQKFANSNERKDHCVSEHKFPKNFRYDEAIKPIASKPKSGSMKMDVSTGESSVKPAVLKNITFGQTKRKGFASSNAKYTGRKFTNDDNVKSIKDGDSVLKSDHVMSELGKNLPE